MKTIKLINVTKIYQQKVILNEIDLEFEENKTYLIIGTNGAGKSTLIKMILKLVSPTYGEIENDNTIGYIPEKINYPGNMKVIDYLKILGDLRNGVNINKLNSLLEEWGMKEHEYKKLKTLSKGMQQKVLIIQSQMHNPDVYILDEPLNGLDYDMQSFFIENIEKLKKQKKTIIITSHYPYLFEKLIDKTIQIRHQKVYES